MKDITPFPLFRAWYAPAQRFVNEGFLTLDNRFLVEANNQIVPLDMVEVDIFTGQVGLDDHKPVYQNDRVRCGLVNEFGSIIIKEAIVRYSAEHMAFFFEGMDQGNSPGAHQTQVLTVLGHNHE